MMAANAPDDDSIYLGISLSESQNVHLAGKFQQKQGEKLYKTR